MRIVLSPAKKMNVRTDLFLPEALPVFPEKTEQLMNWLKSRDREQLKKLWKCSDKLMDENMERLHTMDLNKHLTPAILSYDGLAYQYMAAQIFEDVQFAYVQKHLRILSGFYGVLKPMDGVTPYRLEMQAACKIDGKKDLYEFWGELLYQEVLDTDRIFINLASKEYSKCIEKYLTKEDRFITIHFCELVNGKLVTKGTFAKMARGDMVRFMAENQIQDPEQIKEYTGLGYRYRSEYSTETDFIFIPEKGVSAKENE